MKLLVDVGNTRIKAMLSNNGTLQAVEYTDDLYQQYPITQLTYASVRHAERIESLVTAAKSAGVKVVEVTTSKQAFGVTCAYETYQTLGIDRWLAVLGAAAEFPNQYVIVVDAGTATTVDFLTANKQHLGGWIIPGLDLMTTSITSQTDKVFDEDNTAFAYGAGDTTPKALKYGCLAAQCGIVQQAVSYFNRPAKVIIAGGTADLMLPYLADLKPIADGLIVFKGLNRF